MSLITRNAKSIEIWQYKSNKINLSGPFGDFLFYVIPCHPNHLLLTGVNSRNVVINPTIPCGPWSVDQASQDFFWYTDRIIIISIVSTFLYIYMHARATRMSPRDFAFWVKSLRGQLFLTESFGVSRNHLQIPVFFLREGLLDAPVRSRVFAEKRDSVELIESLSNYDDDHNDKTKQQFCMCITLFSTFFWHPLHDYHVKPPNLTFYGGRGHTTTNFPSSFWTWIKSLRIKLQEKSPAFDLLSGSK